VPYRPNEDSSLTALLTWLVPHALTHFVGSVTTASTPASSACW